MNNPKASILIVDDEKVNRLLLRSYLELTYENILEAKDGNEAVQIIQDNDVNLVLLDLMMPNLSGYDVLKIVRGNPKFQQIPIIVITALTSVHDNAKAIEMGADAFLTKPFNKVVLGALVKNLLKQDYLQKRLIEAEKNEIFYATVVTANHEINQPLTSILCSANLIEHSYEDNSIKDPVKFNAYINNIIKSAKKISDTLKKLRTVKGPIVKTYLDSVKMIDIDNIDINELTDASFDMFKLSKGSEITEDIVIKKILFVDEEKLITDMVSDFLQDKGFMAEVFSDYSLALEEFKKDPDIFNISIIDIREPEKKGLTLFYEMKKIRDDVKVIFSSAYNIKDDIIEAINIGAEAFLPKPYDINNLIFLIKKILKANENA